MVVEREFNVKLIIIVPDDEYRPMTHKEFEKGIAECIKDRMTNDSIVDVKCIR